MKTGLILSVVALALSGCATMGGLADRLGLDRVGNADVQEPVDPFVSAQASETTATLSPETAAPPPPPTARTAEALDTTTPEQRAAAVAAPTAETARELGQTVATLGSPTEPGLWLKTPLVTQEAMGRVTNPATGKSARVTLIPIDGPATGGSRMSLAAMRLIEASLTDLTEVMVALEG